VGRSIALRNTTDLNLEIIGRGLKSPLRSPQPSFTVFLRPGQTAADDSYLRLGFEDNAVPGTYRQILRLAPRYPGLPAYPAVSIPITATLKGR
jgi:hypothetical protein